MSGYDAQPPYAYVNHYPPAPLRNSGLAVASLVLGLVGLPVSVFTFGIPSILAVVFGHVALSQIRRDFYLSGRGMAIGGLIAGYLVIAGWLFFLLVVIGLAALGI
jgi:hypothetical protein